MEKVYLPLKMAPELLYQPILPGWNISLFHVDLGASSNAAFELEVIGQVGSYGKQLGHLASALEVVIHRLGLLEDAGLSRQERDALVIFMADVARVRSLRDAGSGDGRS